MRRRAPLHYRAKADNARFAANAIVTLDQETQQRCSEQISYRGDPRVSMGEAWFREAALALELIVKAVIAQRIAVVGAPELFVGPSRTAERYRKHWEGFPDFTVCVRRILCADESCVVTENEWRGTHLGTFMG
jgi:hypothetical protein